MLVTQPAPDFKTTAIMPDNSFKDISISDYKGKKGYGYGGGSISMRGSNTKLEFINCVFDDNRVVNASNEYWSGGAIGIRDEAAPSFTGCTFKNNYIESSESGVSAGAVFINSSYNQNDLENTINFLEDRLRNRLDYTFAMEKNPMLLTNVIYLTNSGGRRLGKQRRSKVRITHIINGRNRYVGIQHMICQQDHHPI